MGRSRRYSDPVVSMHRHGSCVPLTVHSVLFLHLIVYFKLSCGARKRLESRTYNASALGLWGICTETVSSFATDPKHIFQSTVNELEGTLTPLTPCEDSIGEGSKKMLLFLSMIMFQGGTGNIPPRSSLRCRLLLWFPQSFAEPRFVCQCPHLSELDLSSQSEVTMTKLSEPLH
jgi:hypothetical protein